MKPNMKNLKYLWMLPLFAGLTACDVNNDLDIIQPEEEVVIPVSAGSADFSNYVSLGNSLTAGYTDNALFQASQVNSLPNIMSKSFAKAGGGAFTQPMMNDNNGGLLLGGNMIAGPRLFFNGAGPAVLPAAPTTEISNILSGPFNNMGVPGAKSFHLLAPGYGNLAGVQLGLANPYFVRFASSSNASVLGDAMAQNPSFFSLWIGNNDVLGYATTGGDGTNPLTDPTMFTQAYGALVNTLTSGGAKGVVANIPDVTSIPFFTTVPYNAVPLDAGRAAALNAGYAAYNGGIQAALNALAGTGLFTQEEADKRMIAFAAGQNAVVIEDESLTDLGAINPAFAALPKYRMATANDLLVLTSASFIGTTVGGNPLLVNGVSVPLADKWVLTPEEQLEIKTATDAFNAVIAAQASANGLAMLDANTLMNRLANGGVAFDEFTLTASLVFGGAFSLDGVHPTARGYAFIANEMLKAIDATYGSNFTVAGAVADADDYPTNYPPGI